MTSEEIIEKQGIGRTKHNSYLCSTLAPPPSLNLVSLWVDHVSLWVDRGMKFPHHVLKSSNSLHSLLCLVNSITKIPLKRVILVRVPCRSEGSCSTTEPGRTMRVVKTTAPLVLRVSTLIPSVPLGLPRVSLWFGGVLLCCLHASTLSCERWAWVAMVHISSVRAANLVDGRSTMQASGQLTGVHYCPPHTTWK
jgi:hypothetical protein